MSNRRRIVSNYFLFPILCIVIYFAIIFLAATSVAVFVGEDYMEHEGKIYFLEGILGLGVLITWIMMKKAMGKEIPPMSTGKPVDWIYSVIAALAMLGVAVIYFKLVEKSNSSFVKKALDEYEELMQTTSSTKVDLYLNVFATCFMIPIIEETIFRGMVMEGMLELNHVVAAIVCSSIYFGAMHGQIIQIGYAILAGAMLGMVYYLTKNLDMSILAHAIFNIMGSGIYLIFSISDQTDKVLSYIECAALLPFVGMTVYLVKTRKKRFSEMEEKTDKLAMALPEDQV